MLRQAAGSVVMAALLREYEYDAIETCAGDGSCALACSVGINTGVLIKQFCRAEHNHPEEYVAKKIVEHWATAEGGARAALRLNHIATTVYGGALLAEGALTAARAVVSKDLRARHESRPRERLSLRHISSRSINSSVESVPKRRCILEKWEVSRMDNLLAARSQMRMSLAFHIILCRSAYTAPRSDLRPGNRVSCG